MPGGLPGGGGMLKLRFDRYITQQDGKKRLKAATVTGLLLACFVWNSLNINFFALLQKDLF